MNKPNELNELKERLAFVQSEYDAAHARMERQKLGSARRLQLAKWCGCLNFNILTIKGEIADVEDESKHRA